MKVKLKIFLEPIIKEFELDDKFLYDEMARDLEEDNLLLGMYREQILREAEIDSWIEESIEE